MELVNLSNQEFLQELHRQWNQNPVVATLNARLRPMEIPIEVMQIAGDLQQCSQEQQQLFRERQEINSRVERTGLSGGGGLGVGWNGPNPNDLMFYRTMAEIRASQDNPQPVPPVLVSQGASILQGQVDPIQVYTQMGDQVAGYGQLLLLQQGLMQMLGAMAGDVLPILKQQALVLAALSVPQDQIPELLADSRVTNPNPNVLSRLLTIISSIFQ